ncbi:hypothetical protein APHAL10511_006209 [Amanita phalloides]|nr:hypothetical protein APHAL10511_006209 [Amanita phalloides]
MLTAKRTGILDSPGSSVFDLPAQHRGAPGQAGLTPLKDNTLGFQLQEPQKDDTSCIVISGGTGGNAICTAFENASYVLPVSDDGGSSSEIIRVLGGPSIGDIRSRLIRLIPTAPASSPLYAIQSLLAYRLPAGHIDKEARDQWREIVEGKSKLWLGIPHDRKETIRRFLVYFENEILRRSHKNFDFRNGSIGNFFLAAAQEFFTSLPSAIFLFSSITHSQASILPVIITNHTATIAAELEDGERLVGQCEISHPVSQQSFLSGFTQSVSGSIDGMGETLAQPQNIIFDSTAKNIQISLPSPISRVFYINAYGMEVHPSPNPDYLASLSDKDVLVYSCGSLWTSIIPCLALRGVAAAIARSPTLRAKILLLNSVNDRETEGYSAVDYIRVIVNTLNANYNSQPFGLGNMTTTYPVSAFITDMVYLKGTNIEVVVERITQMGVKCIELDAETTEGVPKYNASGVRPIAAPAALRSHTQVTMTAKTLSVSKIISNSNLHSSDVSPPMLQLVSVRHDSVIPCSASEPNLALPNAPNELPSVNVSRADEQGAFASPLPRDKRTPLVRFQSRVRITSGISRHHSKSAVASDVTISISSRSSPASSRASSVYAPLRPRSEDEHRRLNRGPAQGMGVVASSRGRRRSRDGEKFQRQCMCEYTRKSRPRHATNERTPLLKSMIESTFEREGIILKNDDTDEAQLSDAVDFNFGPWPGRLLNRYWWWWRMEPVLCCYCLDESDTEY